MNEIERRKTISYPTRYSAFEQPGILFEQEDTELFAGKKGESNGGREFAVYYEPVQNRDIPELIDGLYASVVSFQGRHYCAEVQATQPWKGRKQNTAHKDFAKYADAVSWVLEQIPISQEFIKFPGAV